MFNLRPPPPPTEYSDELLRELTGRIWGGHSYDELQALGGMLIGSPEQVQQEVQRLETLGIETLLLSVSFGHLSNQQVCRTLELFAEAVIRPRLSGAVPAARSQDWYVPVPASRRS